jgi:hypothetical protein
MSKSGYTPQKKEIVGPGRYSPDGSRKMARQQSPAFADGAVRLGSSDNHLPGPADYCIPGLENSKELVYNTRYKKNGDWIAMSMSDAPSPEAYTIDRSLSRTAAKFPTSEFDKQTSIQKVGPGSYDTALSSVNKPTYNSGVIHMWKHNKKRT